MVQEEGFCKLEEQQGGIGGEESYKVRGDWDESADVGITVGFWLQHCPMVLGDGFDGVSCGHWPGLFILECINGHSYHQWVAADIEGIPQEHQG